MHDSFISIPNFLPISNVHFRFSWDMKKDVYFGSLVSFIVNVLYNWKLSNYLHNMSISQLTDHAGPRRDGTSVTRCFKLAPAEFVTLVLKWRNPMKNCVTG